MSPSGFGGRGVLPGVPTGTDLNQKSSNLLFYFQPRLILSFIIIDESSSIKVTIVGHYRGFYISVKIISLVCLIHCCISVYYLLSNNDFISSLCLMDVVITLMQLQVEDKEELKYQVPLFMIGLLQRNTFAFFVKITGISFSRFKMNALRHRKPWVRWTDATRSVPRIPPQIPQGAR